MNKNHSNANTKLALERRYLNLPLQLARFEGWVVPLGKCLEMTLRAHLGLKENLGSCVEPALELLSPSFNLSLERRQRLERDILIPSWKDVKRQRLWAVRSCNGQSAISVVPSFSPCTASSGNVVTCTAQVTSFVRRVFVCVWILHVLTHKKHY